MFSTLRRARPLIGIWAATTGLAALLIVVRLDDVGLVTGLLSPNVWIATASGVGVAILSSPILTAPWMRWYWGALASLPLGGIVLFSFFFIRPHTWQPSRMDAWKSVGMFIGLYPEIIIPACLIAGALGGLMVSRATEASPSLT